MSEIVFFLEERSAEEMLRGFLPKILPTDSFCRFIVFEGKQDLEGQLVKRLKGYRVPKAKFVVLRDKDSGDCSVVKKKLVAKCMQGDQKEALVRIACHELESWYLADLSAVEKGLKATNLARRQNDKPYDVPDAIALPSQVLRAIAPAYQKVSGSRAIGPHLDPLNQRSSSFAAFVSGLKKLLTV